MPSVVYRPTEPRSLGRTISPGITRSGQLGEHQPSWPEEIPHRPSQQKHACGSIGFGIGESKRPLAATQISQKRPLKTHILTPYSVRGGIILKLRSSKHAHCPRQDASTTSIITSNPCVCRLPSPLHPAPRPNAQ